MGRAFELPQALAKLERGHARDLDDVRAMIESGLVRRDELLQRFEEIRPMLNRYPAIQPDVFEQKVRAFVDADAGG